MITLLQEAHSLNFQMEFERTRISQDCRELTSLILLEKGNHPTSPSRNPIEMLPVIRRIPCSSSSIEARAGSSTKLSKKYSR
jgi:hypothetical protein